MASFIPPEVVFDILSRLPVKSLLRFKTVNKPWLRLISDPQFVAAHLQRSKKHPRILFLAHRDGNYHIADCFDTLISYDEEHQTSHGRLLQVMHFDRVNPHHCDGLIMIYSQFNIVVCNPCTRGEVNLICSHFSKISPGFGFDPWTNSYKVVHLYEAGDELTLQCEVFTLGSDRSWRMVGKPPDCVVMHSRESATVDGVVYWASSDKNPVNRQLLAFNLKDETFRIIQIQNPHEFEDYGHFFLTSYEGHLYLILLSQATSHREIWVLSEHDNTWTMKYSFECNELQYYDFCPEPIILSGERILFYFHYLYIYDARNPGLKTITVDNDYHHFCCFAIHAESMTPVGRGPTIDEN